MDNEKDRFIKKSLQKDQLISRKADETINAFLKEGMKMSQEEKTQKQIKKNPWKKVLATAACLVVLLGAGQVYASTQGYGNIFFLIKYLITGQNDYVSGKDDILSDRDITISYEPIKLTDKVSLVIKKLQIKDNTAKLFLITNVDGTNINDVPLTFKIKDNDNNELCTYTSKITEQDETYTDEVILNNFKNSTKIIKLEITDATSRFITTLVIDLENRTVEVEGAKEALQKISEIDLKEFLGYASGMTINADKPTTEKISYDPDSLFHLACLEMAFEKLTPVTINGVDSYKVSDVKDIMKSIVDLPDDKLPEPGADEYVRKVTNNGTQYYQDQLPGDVLFKGECINVNNISYCNGVYTTTYTYWFNPTFYKNVDINDYPIYEQTLSFVINQDTKYTKFKVVSSEVRRVIQDPENRVEDPEPTTTTTPETTDAPVPTVAPQISDNNEKVDNYATSMKWTEYWAPGLKFQYPTSFNFQDVSTGDSPGEVSTTAEGLARGIDPDTKQIIDSNLKITTYEPRVVSIEEGEAYLKNNTLGFTNSRGMFWGLEYNPDHNIEVYRNYDKLTSGGELVGYVELKISFETNNRENYKVTNIINWVLGSTKSTSY